MPGQGLIMTHWPERRHEGFANLKELVGAILTDAGRMRAAVFTLLARADRLHYTLHNLPSDRMNRESQKIGLLSEKLSPTQLYCCCNYHALQHHQYTDQAIFAPLGSDARPASHEGYQITEYVSNRTRNVISVQRLIHNRTTKRKKEET